MKTKPFNIEEAKAGAKVVNRAGEPIRIIWFDSKCTLCGRPQPIIDDLARAYCEDGRYSPFAKLDAAEDLLLVSEPKLRPWKPEEVPVGAVVKYQSTGIGFRRLICANISLKIQLGPDSSTGSGHSPEEVLRDYKWKWPHEPESDWKPCGVEE